MSLRAPARFGWWIAALVGLLTACAQKPQPTRALLRSPFVSHRTPLPTVALRATPTRASASVGSELATPLVLESPLPPLTATPGPTTAPAPRLRQLTDGSCCTAPTWSADSRFVQFIDRPASRPLGLYGVDVEKLGPPELLREWIVQTSASGQFYIYPDGNATIVQDAATGAQDVISNGGRPVSVSPAGRRVLWNVIEERGDFDQRRNQTWIADVDGGQARRVGVTLGYNASAWIDEGRILLVGLPVEDPAVLGIAVLELAEEGGDDHVQVLAEVTRPRGTLLSPGGEWLLYYLSFQEEPKGDGLWILPTDGHQVPRKLGFFGGYRWRDRDHLLYVPMDLEADAHTLWEYDVGSQKSRPLTDPGQTPFRIANNDWAVSPNGRYIVFVRASDHNLWLLDLLPSPGE